MTRSEAIRDLIWLFCGREPPFTIEVENVRDLPEKQHEDLQFFLAQHVKMKWLTGIGVIEMIDKLIDESESNSIKAFEEAYPFYAPTMDFKPGDAVKIRSLGKSTVGLVLKRKGKSCTIYTRVGSDTGQIDIQTAQVVDVLHRESRPRW